MISVLRAFSQGKTAIFEKNLFNGLNIVAIRVASRAPIFNGIGTPLVVLSPDQGKTWAGMIKTRYREAPVETWIDIYYRGFVDQIYYKPCEEFFIHDFRRVSIYKPDESKLTVSKIFEVDARAMQNIKISSYGFYHKIFNFTVLTPGDLPMTVEPCGSTVHKRRETTNNIPPPLPPKNYYRLKTASTKIPSPKKSPSYVSGIPPVSPRKSPKRVVQDLSTWGSKGLSDPLDDEKITKKPRKLIF
jgi:hypothetical protein